jgi:Family of unknown function (DUF5988)
VARDKVSALVVDNKQREIGMRDFNTTFVEGDAIEIVLEGGPAGIPERTQASPSEISETKIKIPYCGGYEHFELVSEPSSRPPLTFRWTMRTKIAE